MMPLPKILIAEDEPDVLEIMARGLTKADYEVITAADGNEAWERIQDEVPDVIVLDLIMPGMDGWTVLKKLRKNPPSEIWQPVIIVSAKGELEDLRQGFNLQADHYLTKPFQMDDLIKAVKIMVNLIPIRKSKFELKREKS